MKILMNTLFRILGTKAKTPQAKRNTLLSHEDFQKLMKWNVQEVVDEIQHEEQERFKDRKAGLHSEKSNEYIEEEVFYL